MTVAEIVAKFGGQSALAAMLGKGQSTVAYWVKTNSIPAKWQPTVLEAAEHFGIGLTAADLVSTIKSKAATYNTSNNNGLSVKLPVKVATPQEVLDLDLGIEKQIEIDGVGMGVLSDGTPFLTGRGLARLAGVVHKAVQDIATEWVSDEFPRTKKIREILQSHGDPCESPYIEIKQRSGSFYAYPDTVCIAVLEYYAFDAGPNIKEEAKRNYRLLAGKALREFIYTQVGYDPNKNVPDRWRQFHDRVSLTYNSVPKGYFGIFKEIADMIVTLGQSGLHIDSNFVPDISVGQAWAKHWCSSNLEQRFGERTRFEHNYPSYFPQAASNPQEPWCYPEAALGEFRRWFREDYIGAGKFQRYLEAKVKERALPVSFAQLAVAAYVKD